MKIPENPPDYLELMRGLTGERLSQVMRYATPAPGGKYLHWEELRHRKPPDSLTPEEWWVATKVARSAVQRWLPLRGNEGWSLSYGLPDPVPEILQRVDSQATGSIQFTEPVTTPDMRDRYIISSLIEEAITSSQLEGASTTRKVAEQMIRASRPPRDRNELMIMNNYRAMQRIRGLVSEPLSPQLLLDLHRVLTEGTLDDANDVGRFRTDHDDVKVWDKRDNTLLHVPPPASELDERVDTICRFGNADIPDHYVHPVVRAVLLHFWLAYDHPFVDGNGRTARALFYWSMLKQDYWLCEYLSISSIFKKAPVKYARAFLDTETDGGDATYFLIRHLEVIHQAIDAMMGYLKRKMHELKQTEALIRNSAQFNHRQIDLLGHALRNPGNQYTVKSHEATHGIVYMTARADLLGLEKKGLLRKRKVGRRFVFQAPPDLADRLAKAP